MTVGRARAILSMIWVGASMPLIALFFLQTVTKKYDEWDIGFGWLTPLLLPVLSFMIATWTVAHSRKDKIVLQNGFVFWASLFLSVFYLGLLYVVALRMPSDIDEIQTFIKDVLRPSSWPLGTLQAIVVAAIGKFFLEDVSGEVEESPSHSAKKKKTAPPT